MPYLGKTPSQATRQRYYLTASGGETSISGTMTTGGTLTFNDGEFVDVKLNGVSLVAGTDYNTTTANTIGGLSALAANDQVEIIVYDTFSVFGGNVDGDFNINGGNLTLVDNDKIILGTGGDLELSHNGTNSIIEGKTGDLILRTVGTESIFLQDAGGNNLAQFNDNSDVKLYHNANEKLATTSSGVDITGGFTATDGSTITTDDNSQNLILISTDADASVGPELHLRRNSSSPANSDACGEISFNANNDAGQDTNIVSLDTVIHNVADGSEEGGFDIRTKVAGTMRSRMIMYGSTTKFNDAGQDIDFIVEGNNPNAFFVRGSDSRVGIKTNAPEHDLDVVGDTSGPYLVRFFNDGNAANRKGLKIQCGQDSGDQVFIAFEDGDGNSVGSVQGSSGTAAYNTFTAGHPAILPSSDAAAGYPYGTLVETTGITYSTDSGGNTTRNGIIYSVQKSSSANSKSVLGAYASKDNVNDGQHIVYVLGDGHILCNNSGGNIAVGDGICTSATAGIGQKATASPSMIIGIAQEAVTFANDSETKLVPVQYGLQQFTPWS